MVSMAGRGERELRSREAPLPGARQGRRKGGGSSKPGCSQAGWQRGKGSGGSLPGSPSAPPADPVACEAPPVSVAPLRQAAERWCLKTPDDP